MMVDYYDFVVCMFEFKLFGYCFYVDDFGIGYFNFVYLIELLIIVIKMD